MSPHREPHDAPEEEASRGPGLAALHGGEEQQASLHAQETTASHRFSNFNLR
jgi:hypothetical protein